MSNLAKLLCMPAVVCTSMIKCMTTPVGCYDKKKRKKKRKKTRRYRVVETQTPDTESPDTKMPDEKSDESTVE